MSLGQDDRRVEGPWHKLRISSPQIHPNPRCKNPPGQSEAESLASRFRHVSRIMLAGVVP